MTEYTHLKDRIFFNSSGTYVQCEGRSAKESTKFEQNGFFIDMFSRLYVANIYKVLLTHDNFILGQRIIKCLHTLDLSLHTKQIITKMGKLHKMKKTSNFADGKTNLLTIYLALMYCTCNQYNNVFN